VGSFRSARLGSRVTAASIVVIGGVTIPDFWTDLLAAIVVEFLVSVVKSGHSPDRLEVGGPIDEMSRRMHRGRS
jgi:hypothetical protein